MSQDIKEVYKKWDARVGDRWAYYQRDVRFHTSEREWFLSRLLHAKLGSDGLRSAKILDVGCGYGRILSTLVEWGASPSNMVGVELLPDRLEVARVNCPREISWHLGELESLGLDCRFDIVLAFTVLSSIVDKDDRGRLVRQMSEHLTNEGQLVIFDLRYNNPRNKNVSQVTRSEIVSSLPDRTVEQYTLGLLPPISRVLAPRSLLLTHVVARLIPFLRSHNLFVVGAS